MHAVTMPEEPVGILRSIWNVDTIQLKEEFIVLLLSNNKRCLGLNKISVGGSTAAIVDPAPIFQVTILGNASSIILSHNHPSGYLSTSITDNNLTNRVQEAGKMLGIAVDDHIYSNCKQLPLFNGERANIAIITPCDPHRQKSSSR
jgi:DNA repair protein RadC